jgi:hypothetical protein
MPVSSDTAAARRGFIGPRGAVIPARPGVGAGFVDNVLYNTGSYSSSPMML